MTPVTMSAAGQKQFDVAVVIPTVLRPTLARAVRSVFRQDLHGRIQLLIGIDQREADGDCLDALARECPEHVGLTILDLGYSTSYRHGGVYPNQFGGALRTILSYAANSKRVAYLDDDDWWARDHLSGLLSAIEGKEWAFSYRWLVDRETGWPICRDEWDSVGPGRGINQQRYGGFVSPSTLLLDKEACHFVLPYWSLCAFPDGSGEDRLVFRALQKHAAWAASGRYSCYYAMPHDGHRQKHHAKELAARDIGWIGNRAQIERIARLANEAATALGNGATDDAIAACRGALAWHKHHAPSLHCLALAERQAGHPSEALSHIAEAMAVDDRDPAIVATWTEMNAGTSGGDDRVDGGGDTGRAVPGCAG
jgi:hypothetical protein